MKNEKALVLYDLHHSRTKPCIDDDDALVRRLLFESRLQVEQNKVHRIRSASVTIDFGFLGALVLFPSRPFCRVPERVTFKCTLEGAAALAADRLVATVTSLSLQVFLTNIIHVLVSVGSSFFGWCLSKPTRPFVLDGPTPGPTSFASLQLILFVVYSIPYRI